MNPVISIIVPIYNVENYLRKCIDSILNQSFRNFELILINDGSPDNCPEICDNYAEIDSRVRVVHKENGGLSEARNFGIDIAKGDYIGFVDSDDWIEYDMFEVMYEQVIKYQADIVVCGRYEVFNNVATEFKEYSGEVFIYNNKQSVSMLLEDKEINHFAWDKIYKKELFSSIRYPIGKYYEDIFTTHRLFIKSEKVVFVSRPKYYYLKRAESITGSISSKKVYDKFCASVEQYKNIKGNNYNSLVKLSLSKALNDGVGVYNYQLREDDGSNKNYSKNFILFIKKNLFAIVFNKNARVELKIAILLILLYNPLYNFFYKKYSKKNYVCPFH
ncbi:glycosyltransferase family 2 protein [Paenibacillus sp. URB8-2]|uniref:glycosyltransferase family 2 protein n=1 Tax=Paenibacillus sp. URB8-2 TaxID=2741301 RepID=UPI0015BE212A|nr:glycosyltransferase family 2 protein [Paenibacillus sp. URB8-2]BCG60547.1 hypothetical protein PUR_39720 [Paenibacillus sp. URB8-2]